MEKRSGVGGLFGLAFFLSLREIVVKWNKNFKKKSDLLRTKEREILHGWVEFQHLKKFLDAIFKFSSFKRASYSMRPSGLRVRNRGADSGEVGGG